MINKKFMQKIIILSLSLLLIPSILFPQTNISTVSIKFGAIRTLFSDESFYKGYFYTFYPEVQIGGTVLKKYIHWGINWGFWDDNVSKPFPVKDFVSYSYSSHIIGSRLAISVNNIIKEEYTIKLSPFCGLSRHFVRAKYVGGFGVGGNPGFDHTQIVNTVDIGINIKVKVYGHIQLIAEIQQFNQLDSFNFGFVEKRNAYKTGFSYEF